MQLASHHPHDGVRASTVPGPISSYSDELHGQKYRLPGETFRDAMGRIASALKDSDEHYHAFRDILLDMRFMPGGRIQAAVGSPKAVTPFNCYVSGTIPDSFVHRDNPEQSSIMDRAREAAATMRMGGGIGYDWSPLRPRKALIQKLMSESSGPAGFMPIFDAICKATSSSGNRRGAQMGVLRIDHPDIMEFIHAKHTPGALTGFNLSVGVTDEFMACLAAGTPFDLRHGGVVYSTVDPAELWEALMRSTWDYAEPGVIFIDRVNKMNNLWYCEKIAATNPCGEQPLPPFGACCLGSFNLVRYLLPTFAGMVFDWEQFAADIAPVVRAIDNVFDQALYPLPEQRIEAITKRRMGLGVTALANAGEALGYRYGSPEFLEFEARVLHMLARQSYLTGTVLAQEKGAFPLYDERYLESAFIKTLDFDVQEQIALHGVRNSHYGSIAPTGTISMTADNVSSSIEPVYRYQQTRTVNMLVGPQQIDLYDYGFLHLGVRGARTSMGEVTAAEHVAVLTTAQRYIDSAVSKTVNCDGSMPWEEFKGIYQGQPTMAGRKVARLLTPVGKGLVYLWIRPRIGISRTQVMQSSLSLMAKLSTGLHAKLISRLDVETVSEPIPTVYLLRNLANNKLYVGQTRVGLATRLRQHRHAANSTSRHTVSNAIRKYGWENFEAVVLEETDEAGLDMAERFWIACYGSLVPNGYNCETSGSRKGKGSSHDQGSDVGGKVAHISQREDTSQDIRFEDGLKMTGEVRAAQSIARKGRPGRSPTTEERARISKALKGRSLSFETRRRMSAAQYAHGATGRRNCE